MTPPRLQAGVNRGQTPYLKRQLRVKGRRDLVADQMRAASIYWHYEKLERDAKKLARKERTQAGIEENQERKETKLPARGVTFCGWTQIAERPTELLRVRDEDQVRAYFSGLQACGLRWVCPCCTASAAQIDRKRVNDGLAGGRKRGLWPVMITMTTRHDRTERAEDVLAGIIRAEQRLKRVKAWRRFSEKIAGYARAFEWTHGKNGHHPHFHMIVLVKAKDEEEAINAARELREPYMRQLKAAGRDGSSVAAWEHSFQVQGAAEAGAYVAKWGSAEELTGALAKSGAGEGLTPWQLLRLARTAPEEPDRQKYAAIWWEIMCATKGRAQLYISEGWKKLIEEDAEAEKGELKPELEPELVMGFGVREKRGTATAPWLDALPKRLVIREVVEWDTTLEDAILAVSEALRAGPTDLDLIAIEADQEMFE